MQATSKYRKSSDPIRSRMRLAFGAPAMGAVGVARSPGVLRDTAGSRVRSDATKGHLAASFSRRTIPGIPRRPDRVARRKPALGTRFLRQDRCERECHRDVRLIAASLGQLVGPFNGTPSSMRDRRRRRVEGATVYLARRQSCSATRQVPVTDRPERSRLLLTPGGHRGLPAWVNTPAGRVDGRFRLVEHPLHMRSQGHAEALVVVAVARLAPVAVRRPAERRSG